MNYAAILDTYSLDEIIELNDLTTEEALEYLVVQGIIKLPEVQPLEFDE